MSTSLSLFRVIPAARPSEVPTAVTYVSVRAGEAGTAILTSLVDPDNDIDVQGIDRLPAGLAPAVAWLRAQFPNLPVVGDGYLVIDADGYGDALADTLRIRRRSHVALFDKRGKDRQGLVNALLVAEQERRIHLDPGSAHADAMRKALLSYRRTVGEDGVIGGELVVALALAAVSPRLRAPRVY